MLINHASLPISFRAISTPRLVGDRGTKGGTAPTQPQCDPGACLRSNPNQPSRDASAYANRAAAYPHDLAVALSVHARTTTTPEGMHDARYGTVDPEPTHIHRAGTRPCAWPALPPELRHSASPHHGTVRHLGSAAPLCTAAPLHFSAPRSSLRGTLLHLSLHRSAPLHLTAPLRMLSAAPCARRSAYRAKCRIDALTESPGCQLRHGVLA